jgi:hypothetical protein
MQYRNDLVYMISPASTDAELDEAAEWLASQLEIHAYTLDDARRGWVKRRLSRSERKDVAARNRHYSWLAKHAAIAGFELARRQRIAHSCPLQGATS